MLAIFFYHIAVVITMAAAVPIRRDPNTFCWQKTDTVFVFGDSYSAVGGEKGSSSTWSLFESDDAVSNNPIILHETTASGPNWSEYITGCYEGRPQDCSIHLFNLAYNGATVNSQLVKPWRPIVADFIQQVKLWKDHVASSVQSSNAVSFIWFGINDVSKSIDNDDIEDLFTKDIGDYFAQMEALYQSNIRRFVMINVPPVDRTPKFAPDKDVLIDRISKYNTMLHDNAEDFRKRHTDIVIVEIDAHQLFSNYLSNPQQIRVQDTTNYYEKEGTDSKLPIQQ
ncbi:lysophospholipase a [Lichtheimia corymbifera JMRC:FSU:9682]|uniref:Lysophospholipase a n=1 Tax=Lichtheimia corymbifera JMRC:FSU:9682 TaxID=1263082 RepID=A0A068RWX6_9FUNG|nr:lysophospholipase a [Lichtheimia corymbifera JMRC:FSU:9682]